MGLPKNHKTVGDRSEVAIINAFVQAGKIVLMPTFQTGLRYDFAVDNDGTLVRVQCKSGRLKDGSIVFDPQSSSYQYRKKDGTTYGRKGYSGEADIFGIFCHSNNKCYIVPVSVSKQIRHLRIEPLKVNRTKGIHWAKDYELVPVLHETENEQAATIHPKKQKEKCKRLCFNCKEETTNKKFCSYECCRAFRDSHIPNANQLKQDFDQLKTRIAVAEKYGVSDTAIKKWQKKYEKNSSTLHRLDSTIAI